jgi:hypothetical protein
MFGFISTLGTIVFLVGFAVIAYFGFDIYKKFGSPGLDPKYKDLTSSGNPDLRKAEVHLEAVRTNTNSFLDEIRRIDLDRASVGQIKTILAAVAQITGQLNGVNALLDRKSYNDRANGFTKNPLDNIFGVNAPNNVVMAAANVAGIYGEDAVEEFLRKARAVDSSVTDALSFSRLSTNRRKQITAKVSDNNMSLG